MPQHRSLRRVSLTALPNIFFLFLALLLGGGSSIALADDNSDIKKIVQEHITALERAVIEFRNSQPKSIVELNYEYQKCTELLRSSQVYLPVKRAGVVQEISLTLLTKIVRGADFVQGATLDPQDAQQTLDNIFGWNFTSLSQIDLTHDVFPVGGAEQFKSTLKETPLDRDGLNLLKNFLLAYEGVEEADILQDMLETVKRKKPTNYKYADYDYISIKEEGEPSFSYEMFRYDPKKEQIVPPSRPDIAQKTPVPESPKGVAPRNPHHGKETQSIIEQFEIDSATKIIGPIDEGLTSSLQTILDASAETRGYISQLPVPKRAGNSSRNLFSLFKSNYSGRTRSF